MDEQEIIATIIVWSTLMKNFIDLEQSSKINHIENTSKQQCKIYFVLSF